MDQLARSDDRDGHQSKGESCEWDLNIVDEAHKMSVSYLSNEL